jgi:hypothetical protein
MGAKPRKSDKITVAVITGQHPFDVPAFHALFRSIPEIDFYPQHLEDFVSDAGGVRRDYNVLLFYHFHQANPGAEQGWWERGTREALEQLGETRQGIFVLHHAILAFPKWPLWSEIVGIADRSFQFDVGQELFVEIADPGHPITRDLQSWRMVDETYLMANADEGSHVLLTTNHPRSMRTLAWTRQHKHARVFCCQSGHDARAYANESFRTVVSRAVQWLAGRL